MNVPETFSLRIASPSATCPLAADTTEYDMRFCAEGTAAGAASTPAPSVRVERDGVMWERCGADGAAGGGVLRCWCWRAAVRGCRAAVRGCRAAVRGCRAAVRGCRAQVVRC